MREVLIANASIILWVVAALEAVIAIIFILRCIGLKTDERRSFALLAFFLTLGLLFDTVVMLLGNVVSTSDLMIFSRARFVLHGLLIPLLLPLGAFAMGWKRVPVVITWIVTLLLMAAGVYMGLNVVLEQQDMAGITRFAMSDATPQIAVTINTVLSFGTVIPLIVAGIVTMIRRRGPWVFLGGLAMFAFSAIGPATGNTDLIWLISALGELLMVFFFLMHVLQDETKLKARIKEEAKKKAEAKA